MNLIKYISPSTIRRIKDSTEAKKTIKNYELKINLNLPLTF